MKKFVLFLVPVLMLIVSGCSKDDSNPINPPGNGGNGGQAGNVNFAVNLAQDDEENIYFKFVPDKNCIVTEVIIVCTALELDQQLLDESGQVFKADNPVLIGPVTALQEGQVWQFTIKGKVENTSGKDFESTVNFTVE